MLPSTCTASSRKQCASTSSLSSSVLVFAESSALPRASRRICAKGSRAVVSVRLRDSHFCSWRANLRARQQGLSLAEAFWMAHSNLQTWQVTRNCRRSLSPSESSPRVSARKKRLRRMQRTTSRMVGCRLTLSSGYQNSSPGVIRLSSRTSSMRVSRVFRCGVRAQSGGKARGEESMRLVRAAMLLCSKGHTPHSISQKMTPSDHTSARASQGSPFRISGDMQSGDPTMVAVISRSRPSSLQKPKSANFTTPSWKRMFPGFRSRCRMWAACSTRQASRSCWKQASAWLRGRGPWERMRSARVPPLQYSQTRQQLWWVRSISTKRMMFLWSILDSAAIQLLVNSVSLGVCLNLAAFITFTANYSPLRRWVARQTFPYCPLPIFSSKVQLSTTLFIIH